MAVEEREIEQKQKRLARLREQTAEARSRRTTNERAVANELTSAHLDADIAEHEAILAREKEHAKLTTIRDGSKSNLDHAKSLMAAAAAAEAASDQAPAPTEVKAEETKDAEETKATGNTVKVKTGEEK
jgi:hypothetical protein